MISHIYLSLHSTQNLFSVYHSDNLSLEYLSYFHKQLKANVQSYLVSFARTELHYFHSKSVTSSVNRTHSLVKSCCLVNDASSCLTTLPVKNISRFHIIGARYGNGKYWGFEEIYASQKTGRSMKYPLTSNQVIANSYLYIYYFSSTIHCIGNCLIM